VLLGREIQNHTGGAKMGSAAKYGVLVIKYKKWRESRVVVTCIKKAGKLKMWMLLTSGVGLTKKL
jgi:hypothetical protein